MLRILFVLFLLPGIAAAAGTGYRLDHAPIDPNNQASLQAGARTYVNYCLGCHGVQYMRYSKLMELGLTREQIEANLMFTAEKIGEPMKGTLSAKEGKQWFGVVPPDLSVIARSRSHDWLYTYLRAFYRDSATPSGWNNAVFPNVAMPHALWALQGEQTWNAKERKLIPVAEGVMSRVQYDVLVRDLVNFLAYVAEPSARDRKSIGIAVLFVLGFLGVLAWLMKKEFWKDVK